MVRSAEVVPVAELRGNGELRASWITWSGRNTTLSPPPPLPLKSSESSLPLYFGGPLPS